MDAAWVEILIFLDGSEDTILLQTTELERRQRVIVLELESDIGGSL